MSHTHIYAYKIYIYIHIYIYAHTYTYTYIYTSHSTLKPSLRYLDTIHTYQHTNSDIHRHFATTCTHEVKK